MQEIPLEAGIMIVSSGECGYTLTKGRACVLQRIETDTVLFKHHAGRWLKLEKARTAFMNAESLV